MSEQKHTPEPWKIEKGTLFGSNGDQVVAAKLGIGLGQDYGDGERMANTKRIVLSVNACASIPDYQLTGEGGEPTNLAGVIDDLRKQRDELLAENEVLMDAMEKLARLGNGPHYGTSDGNRIAQVAISEAKSKGGAA